VGTRQFLHEECTLISNRGHNDTRAIKPVPVCTEGGHEQTHLSLAATRGSYIPPRPGISGLERSLTGGRLYISDPGTSNNLAEYFAVINGLCALYGVVYPKAVVFTMNRQILAYRYNGVYAYRKFRLQAPLVHHRLAKAFFDDVDSSWTPADQNPEANQVKKGMRNGTG
jgi:hypothetical protein